MTFYSFSYDPETGLGLTVSELTYDLGEIDLQEHSTSGTYYISVLPPDFFTDDFKVDLTRLDNNDLPLYLIARYTGYAYDHGGEHVDNADIEAEERPEVPDVSSYISLRGIMLGDVVDADDTSETIELDDYELTLYESEVEEHLNGIRNGEHVLVNIGFLATGWQQDSETGKFVRVITSSAITPSTVVCLIGINRDAVRSDIHWVTEEGRIVFTTDIQPIEDILINAYLFETDDEWSAKGVIEAWPARVKAKRFNQSMQNNGGSTWSATLSPFGEEGDSLLVATVVDFTNADFLFATPEYVSSPYVIVPQIYIAESTNTRVLVYRITNTSSSSVTVTDVYLRLCYTGVISGLIEDPTGDAIM